MDTLAGIVVVIVLFIALWHWLKKEFPLATDVTATILRGAVAGGAWIVQKGIDLHAAAQRTVTCPHCRTIITIYGMRVCRHCHFHEERNDFAPCSHCGRTGRGFVDCPNCGRSVRPWFIQKRRSQNPRTH